MLKNVNSVLNKIINGIKDFTDVAVIGLSGGADSTLVALLCKKALGKENVYGVHMPYGDVESIDYKKFNNRSIKFANAIGIQSVVIPITDISDNIVNAIESSAVLYPVIIDGTAQHRKVDFAFKNMTTINKGNARSRARMCILYGLAHQLSNSNGRVRVIGTGNKSEDYIGYDTKGGDALADLFPISDLFKSEVYQLLDYFKEQGEIVEEFIDRVPSAGLWANQTDEGELGYTYNDMEPVIRLLEDLNFDINRTYICEKVFEITKYKPDIIKFVIERHLQNKHKHEAPPIINIIDSEEIRD